MTSLMQEFAEARQERLQDHVNFLSRQQLAREQRQQDLQVQSEATAKYLAHAEQTRLEREQGRHAIAAKALASRQEEFQNRASQVSTYLSNLNVDRTKQAAEDGEERAQEVRTRTFKIQSQLTHIHKARIRNGDAARAARGQITADRAALTAMQIEDINKARLENAAIASQLRAEEFAARSAATSAKLQAIGEKRLTTAKQDADSRSQEFRDRAANVKSSLDAINTTRLAEAQAQATKLNDFRDSLSTSVWAGSRAIAAKPETTPAAPVVAAPQPEKKKSKPEVKAESKQGSKPEIAKAPEPAKPVEVKEPVKETKKAPSKIEQFVVDYVAQLSTNSSLLEVVNDRDTVRDLLAQGANTLKVDPSDILNTLLKMAEG